EILTHELVHVFHGQHNPSHEFDGMDDVGWFVEGLAVLVANQLSDERMSRFRKSFAERHVPTRLADCWSGPHRYAIAGSLVRYIEEQWGRSKLSALLGATSNAEILKTLGLSEGDLLAVWRASLAGTSESSRPASMPSR